MKLEELNVYQLSMEIGEKIWSIVIKWDYFSNDTIGRQLVKAVDSVAANISEGFGRYHFKDKKNFENRYSKILTKFDELISEFKKKQKK